IGVPPSPPAADPARHPVSLPTLEHHSPAVGESPYPALQECPSGFTRRAAPFIVINLSPQRSCGAGGIIEEADSRRPGRSAWLRPGVRAGAGAIGREDPRWSGAER